ncbi:unnamed protein product, partial [Amoebophrya sp. A120]
LHQFTPARGKAKEGGRPRASRAWPLGAPHTLSCRRAEAAAVRPVPGGCCVFRSSKSDAFYDSG